MFMRLNNMVLFPFFVSFPSFSILRYFLPFWVLNHSTHASFLSKNYGDQYPNLIVPIIEGPMVLTGHERNLSNESCYFQVDLNGYCISHFVLFVDPLLNSMTKNVCAETWLYRRQHFPDEFPRYLGLWFKPSFWNVFSTLGVILNLFQRP